MKKRTKRILWVILGSLGVLGICLIAFAGYFFYSLDRALNSGQYTHRPDAELIRSFREHRAEFEKLRSMLERDDHIFRIDDDWTDPPNLPKEHVEEYRRLFTIVETPRGFYNRRNPLRIEFISSSQGWVTSGSMKGYVYLGEQPKEGVVTSLDGFFHGTDTSWRSALRPIEGNWYLFFER